MTKLYKFFAIGFVCVYFSISILLVAMIDIKGTVSPENRNLATFPSLSDYKKIPIGFEEWLNDRFGFRLQVISTYRYALYYFFNLLTTQNPIAGENNNFYYIDIINESLNIDNIISDERIKMLAQELTTELEKTKKLPFKLLFLLNANAPLFTYDNLPTYIKLKVDIGNLEKPWQSVLLDNMPNKYKEFVLFPYKDVKEMGEHLIVWSGGDYHMTRKSPHTVMIAHQIALRDGVIDKANQFDYHEFSIKCAEHAEIAKYYGIKVLNKEKEINCV